MTLWQVEVVLSDRNRDESLSVLKTEQGEVQDLPEARVSLVLYHRDGAKVVPLGMDQPIVIGRAWPADVVVRDIKLSRRHAMFTWFEGEVTVDDLGSTNGTLVNGKAVERATIRAGDEVNLGSVSVSLHQLSPRELEAHAVESYDRFADRLEKEVLRARTFHRPFSLLMLRAIGDSAHVRHFLPELHELLRPVDIVGLYGPGTLLVALPEIDGEGARRPAESAATLRAPSGARLLVGVAEYPAGASSAEELVAATRAAARLATFEAPVQLPPSSPDLLPRNEGRVVVGDPKMRALYDMVARVAPSNAPVLVTGETGTGKELVARAIHQRSPRSGKPMRSVNCGAIPSTLLESTLFGHERGAFTGADRRKPGIFEQAEGGTVFLDEIGELSARAQVALLRVLETKRVSPVGSTEEIAVDVRVVAATHRDLEAMCRDGGFRMDLFYRLETITLEVPPLRRRLDEIGELVDLFASEAASASGTIPKSIDPAALDLLRRYSWPGNVRELRNVIERAVVIADGTSIAADDLSDRIRGGSPDRAPAENNEPVGDLEFKERVRQYETDLILDALRRTEGNQTRAAKLLRMPLRTMVHKIKTYGIQKKYGQ